MDRILSEQFVRTFLIPYLKVNILGNADKDPVLQKIFTTQQPLQQEERTALVNKYFKNTATIFDRDLKLRELFWEQFVQFVRRQRNICRDNVRLLAFRTLPDSVTREFSNEAQQNLLKFAYQVANAVQDYKIRLHINNQELNGEITQAKAQDLRAKFQDGKLVMVKDKNGNNKIVEHEEVSRAISNVSYQSDFLSGLTVSGAGGNLVVFPDEIPVPQAEGQPQPAAQGMTLVNLELEIYETQATHIEIILEEAGFFVESKFKPDKTGMVRGYVVDRKTRERLLDEVNAAKPNSKYRFTFVKNPAKTFLVDRNEIQKYFGKEDKSAYEVYDIKQKEEMEEPLPFATRAPAEPPKKAEPVREQAAFGAESAGLAGVSRAARTDTFSRAASGGIPPSIIAAKQQYLQKTQASRSGRRRMEQPAAQQQARVEQPYLQPEQQPELTRTASETIPAAVPTATPKKGFNPAKITGIAAAATVGGSALFTFFV